MKNQTPPLSKLFKSRQPSAVRLTQLEFSKRTDGVEAVNCSIGNVSLPTHPQIQDRMKNLMGDKSPFKDGVVKYSATVGLDETRQAILNIIASSGLETDGLYAQVTDGGSHAMELAILGVCGPAGSEEKPLLMINPAYSNYRSFAERVGRKVVAVTRTLSDQGEFTLPNMDEIEQVIEQENPGAMVVIPFDNPTGQLYSKANMIALAKLAVKHNLWLISDEAYRELAYTGQETNISIWALTEADVPGITGRRISIESASKVWNGCGFRIGWLVTDNEEFHQQCVAENTANLCPPVIASWLIGGLAEVSHDDLQVWYEKQRAYYAPMLTNLTAELQQLLPGVIVSNPDASLYSVVDVRQLVDDSFDAQDFSMYCASEGSVDINDQQMTLLVSPMAGFYELPAGAKNPGLTQMRVSYVETPEKMALVPELFTQLFKQYQAR
jgi:aspartate aminotransferase